MFIMPYRTINHRVRIIIILFVFILITPLLYRSYQINPHALSWLIAALVNLFLTFFVYIHNRTNPLNKTYGLLGLSLATWNFGVFGLFIVPDAITALNWAKIFGIGMFFGPPTFIHLLLC